ncbi:sigma factor regulator [Paenibacillus cellulosilyticus]|uniref:Sigma factor regulator n=1 Tax=Paenibacillus cellulosilyticus TaxID=375489 RepID=A0A2V2YYC3_9BACL|nr:anti-sigma factor [Paenibacillus cellulosilyticus]PWW07258.1 sigma factor regulator [Paenibacillus cellulosilyticus]QKS44553.1 anti sigma factor C-terminal domain-containing protein [Paenibacillus cellulosilyticus]
MKKGKRRSRLFVILASLSTFLLVVLILCCYMYWNSLYVSRWFEPNPQAAMRITSDVIQFNKPGITATGFSGNNRFLSWTYTLKLNERIGREEQTVGTFQDNFKFSKLTGKFNWNNGQHRTPFNFRYPGETFPEGSEQSLNPNGWTTLQKLPEGTVAQLAISLSRPMTHDEYYNLIMNYDVATVWLAIDTGIEKELSTHNQLLGNGLVFGYAPDALNYGENGSGSFTIQVNGEGERRAQAFMNEIEYLLEHPKWTNTLLSTIQVDPHVRDVTLEQRYAFLQKNGITIYGAVLTGPTKELLKLQNNKDVNSPFVGAVDWWNWDQQSANGIEYSY